MNDVCEGDKNIPKPPSCDLTGEENVVRFFNSSTESPPPVRTLRKKEHVRQNCFVFILHIYYLICLILTIIWDL